MAEDQNNPCLIAEVIVDQKLPLVLSYKVPSHLENIIQEGCRCQIPLRQKTLKGFVLSLKKEIPSSPLKTLLDISDSFILPRALLKLCEWMSRYYATPLSKVLHFFVPKIMKESSLTQTLTHGQFNPEAQEELLLFLQTKYPRRKKVFAFVESSLQDKSVLSLKEIKKTLSSELYQECVDKNWIIAQKKTSQLEFETVSRIKKTLTEEQQDVSLNLRSALRDNRLSVHLIHGVCGSGKTEVYFEAIEEALQQGLGIIYMVPEVALAPQTINRLKSRFNVPIALIHHQVSDGIKKQDFEDLIEGRVSLVVGARSAIFAPIKNLGLIIIDEEHESAYKQEGMPTYHAKDVAIMRARIEHAMVILGSATPSIETFYQATIGKIILHTLKSRPFKTSMPDIELVSLGTEFQKAQGLGLFAEPTLKALEENFKRGEQSLIFINRRGYNALVQCSSCAEAIKCNSCSIPMTFHKQDNKLICHFCGFQTTPPQVCPLCSHETMQYKGVGTQLVEAKLSKTFKESRVLRIDKDSTAKKGSLDNYFQIFSSQGADILIGTQMIAKGLDFSGLTLAIILNIDGTFNRPDFRAHEEAFQLMMQVAGRVGRSILKGKVYIQTFNPHHPLCLKAKEHDYLSFYRSEIEERKLYSYPPFSRLIRFVFSDIDESRLLEYAQAFRKMLARDLPEDYCIEPLNPCFHEVIEKHYRFHFIIKGLKPVKLYQIIQSIDKELKAPSTLRRLIDVDPVTTS
jgi:primosomal protein N' (replication factor Y) (superfamily II helicase)